MWWIGEFKVWDGFEILVGFWVWWSELNWVLRFGVLGV